MNQPRRPRAAYPPLPLVALATVRGGGDSEYKYVSIRRYPVGTK